MIHAIPWIILGLVLARVVLPMRVKVWEKAAFGIILFLIVGQGRFLFALALLGVLALMRDLIGLSWWSFRKKWPSYIFASRLAAYGLCCAAALLYALGWWQGVRVPEVRAREIAIKNLPTGLEGLKIVQLSDLHASHLYSEKWILAVVEKVNATRPDLVLITGDIADGSPAARQKDVFPLSALTAGLGVYGVPGNHDYFYGFRGWMSVYDDLGIKMLLNEHVAMTHNGSTLVVAGITDSAARIVREPGPDIGAALSGAPQSAFKLLMSHKPANAAINAEAGVALQLSGHTHGGQIFGLHLLVAPFNGGYVSGLYSVGTMQLYVSRGTGLWPRFPVRLGSSSEIALITLKCE
jgi:predicted MPP superfamily phosphohydrolase